MSACTTKTVTAGGWTDLEVGEGIDTIVVQNDGARSIRLHIGASAPSDALADTDGILVAPNAKVIGSTGGEPTTFALESGDGVWARVLSSYLETRCRVNVWQESGA